MQSMSRNKPVYTKKVTVKLTPETRERIWDGVAMIDPPTDPGTWMRDALDREAGTLPKPKRQKRKDSTRGI